MATLIDVAFTGKIAAICQKCTAHFMHIRMVIHFLRYWFVGFVNTHTNLTQPLLLKLEGKMVKEVRGFLGLSSSVASR